MKYCSSLYIYANNDWTCSCVYLKSCFNKGFSNANRNYLCFGRNSLLTPTVNIDIDAYFDNRYVTRNFNWSNPYVTIWLRTVFYAYRRIHEKTETNTNSSFPNWNVVKHRLKVRWDESLINKLCSTVGSDCKKWKIIRFLNCFSGQ